MKINSKNICEIIGVICVIIIILFIFPWLSFWFGYFCGWLSKITIGKYLVEGFSLVGLTIPLNKVPLLSGVIGWVACFFGSAASVTKMNNNIK